MKKFDYFFTSLILTLTLVGFVSALLIAEFNSSRYIPAQTPRLIAFGENEVTFLGKTHTVDFSQYEDEIKMATFLIPRGQRIINNTAKIMYEEIKALIKAYSEGG